jgi:hypothetical protein
MADRDPDDLDTDSKPKGKGAKPQPPSLASEPPAPAPADVLIHNAAQGIRQCTATRRAEGMDQTTGLPRHHLTTVRLLPGLNLIPRDQADLVMADIDRCETLHVYEDGLERMHPSTARVLIQGTGDVEVLKTLARRVSSEKVLQYIEAQIVVMTQAPGKIATARARAAHTPRAT